MEPSPIGNKDMDGKILITYYSMFDRGVTSLPATLPLILDWMLLTLRVAIVVASMLVMFLDRQGSSNETRLTLHNCIIILKS